MYTPHTLPPAGDELSRAVQNEFESVAQQFSTPQPVLLLEVSNVAPKKPRAGMIALADGVNWNPGSGAGFYGYRGSAWVLLG